MSAASTILDSQQANSPVTDAAQKDSSSTPVARPRRVFITVAEVSGDQHAAHLIQSLRQLDPTIIIEGLGGPAMRSAGAVIHHETVGRAAMGASAVKRVFEVFGLLKWTGRYFSDHRPDLQICCDSPAMNFHFAKLAKKRGVPVLFYIAPQLWAWREGRMKKLRRWVDQVACILPFEEEYFRRNGVNATFVGHPLFDELPTRAPRPARPDFSHRPPVIGLLPGSRGGEARRNFPPMLEVAHRIRQVFPGVIFLIPTTAATDPVVAERIHNLPFIESRQGAFDEFVPRCDLCLTVSGTATLHVAGHHVPMLVVYRASRLVWHLAGRWLLKTRTYSLVNLLADSHEHIVPEFIPWFGDAEMVADRAVEYLQNPRKLADQTEKLAHLIRNLDKPGASLNVARMAMQLMQT